MVDPLLVSGLVSAFLASIVAGVVGVLIGYTRTQFLAIESLHMIIAASLVGSFVNWHFKAIPDSVVALAAMALFVLAAAVMIDKGYSQETSMGFTIAIASMIASLFSYYAALTIPGGVSYVYMVLFGNPFLISSSDAAAYLLACIALTLIVALLWRVFIYMAFDPETFEILRGGVRIYRWALYILIAFSAIYVTRIIGAIPAHIALMMPGIIAGRIGRRGSYAAVTLLVLSSTASIIASYLTNMPYGALLGIISIGFYLLALTKR